MLFAEALRIPLAQQVIIGLSFFSLFKLLLKVSTEILIEPLVLGICFWREPSETAIGTDRRAGKWGLAGWAIDRWSEHPCF